MPKYSLTKKDDLFLTLEISGKNYNLPLAKSMKIKELRKLMKIIKLSSDEQFDALCEFLAKYMGDEVVDDMTAGDIMEIFNLWKKANNEVDGLKLGESSASSNS